MTPSPTIVIACGQPATLEEADTLTPADLGAHLSGGKPYLLDVRTGAEFRQQRVRGAVHVPLDTLSIEAVQAARPAQASGPICILCKSGTRAAMAAKKLRAAGLKCQVVVGGTDACAKAGLPLARDENPQCTCALPLERQVFLIAGLLVLTGVLLGWQVHPYFYGLSAFVGAGLTVAGATGFCGMALILGKCPWNK